MGSCTWGGEILDHSCSCRAGGEGWLCPRAGVEATRSVAGPARSAVLCRAAGTGKGTVAFSILAWSLAGKRGQGSSSGITGHPDHAMPGLCAMSHWHQCFVISLYWCDGETLDLQNKPHQGGAVLCWVPALGSDISEPHGQIEALFLAYAHGWGSASCSSQALAVSSVSWSILGQGEPLSRASFGHPWWRS